MQFKVDKTVVLVAITKLLNDKDSGYTEWELEDFQLALKVLSSSEGRFIQSVDIDVVDYDYLSPYLEEV